MKTSKIVSFILLFAMFFMTFPCRGMPIAAEEGDSLQKYSSVEDLKVIKKGSVYSIAFRHADAMIELRSEFYRLEGAALYDGSVVGHVLDSNCDILYLAISESAGVLDDVKVSPGKNELLLHIVLMDSKTGQISDICLLLKKSKYAALQKALKSSAMIDTDNELYGQLLHSGLWMKSCLEENLAVPREMVWEDAISSDASLSIEHSELSSYINAAAFVTPACAYGFGAWRNGGKEPAYFYIRDTFKTESSYVTLLAVFQLWTVRSGGTDGFCNISFEVTRRGDYLIEVSGDGTVIVKEAPDHMAYVITQDPSAGIELTEGFHTGYIDACSAEGRRLGSAGTKAGGFWRAAASFLYPAVSTFRSIGSFFGSIARALTGSKQKAESPNPYRLSAELTPAKNPTAYSVACKNNMYKRGAVLKLNMYLEDFDFAADLQVQYQFRITAVGSGYQQNATEGGTIAIRYTN